MEQDFANERRELKKILDEEKLQFIEEVKEAARREEREKYEQILAKEREKVCKIIS